MDEFLNEVGKVTHHTLAMSFHAVKPKPQAHSKSFITWFLHFFCYLHSKSSHNLNFLGNLVIRRLYVSIHAQ